MADPGENLTGALHSNFGYGGWVWLAWKWDSCNDVVKQNPMISIFRKLGSFKSDRGSIPLHPPLDPPLTLFHRNMCYLILELKDWTNIFSTQAIFLYSALNSFTRSRSMTVTIGTQQLKSCPMH